MQKNTIRQGNVEFFVVAVGLSLGTEFFAQAVLNSSYEMASFSTENIRKQGYIKINSADIEQKGYWEEFIKKIREKLLIRVSYGFSSATKFEGELAEKVEIREGGYNFSFEVKEYERSSEYNFEILEPKELINLSEDEPLGRVVYLTIEVDEDTV